MSYEILSAETVIPYILSIDTLKEYFATDSLHVEEIGDGNLNYVYILKSTLDSSKALIVKQAVPYLRCVGESFPLSRDRMSYEIRALEIFYERSPNYIPKIHYANEAMSLVVMQYLDTHIILRHGLINATTYPNLGDAISTYLANALFYTSSLHLQSDKKRQLIDKFNANTELCKLSEDFVFTSAYMQDDTNDNDNVKDNPLAIKLFEDMDFKQKVMELKYKFMTQNDALLHGDLHTGSLMVNEDQTYVIDPEFAFVGPFGFDIGALIANFVNVYIHHMVVTANETYQTYLLHVIEEILTSFETKFLFLWDKQKNSALVTENFLDTQHLQLYKKTFMLNILRESIGFAGCKMARRVFGVAGVEEIRGIENREQRTQAETMVLHIARNFIMKYDTINSQKDIKAFITS